MRCNSFKLITMNQGGEEIKNVAWRVVSCQYHLSLLAEFECEISIWVRRIIHFITEWARKGIIPNPPMYHFAFRCQYKLNQKIWNRDSTFQKDTKETPQLPDRRKPWLGLFKIFIICNGPYLMLHEKRISKGLYHISYMIYIYISYI